MERTSAIGGASLERLAIAIRRGFELIEERFPGKLEYDNVPLRGALERHFYYRALTDPAYLENLVDLGIDRRTFSEWLPGKTAPARLSRLTTYPKAWTRLVFFALFRKSVAQGKSDSSDSAEFVFFVIHPKFVTFFLPVINRIGRHRCALFCHPGYGVEDHAARHGLKVCALSRARVRLGRLSVPPREIFSMYSFVITLFLWPFGTLRRYRPKVVVFAEAASLEEELVARAARALRIPTVRLQYGRAGILSSGYYDMPYDSMLMWGEGFVERIKPGSPDCRYIVTGSPVFDAVSEFRQMAFLKGYAKDSKLVTIITQPECDNILRKDYEALVAVVDRVLSSEKEAMVLVRLHPADFARDFAQLSKRWNDRLRVTTAEDYPLNQVLASSTLVVGLYSTVLSEAVALGVLPVVLRLGDRHRIFPSPEDSGAAALALTPDEAVAQICRLLRDPLAREQYRERMRLFCRYYFGPMDGNAVTRIVEHLERLGAQSTVVCAADNVARSE